MTPLVILGCGFLGTRIAKAALAAGRQVRVCARSSGRLAALGALGAEVKFLDVSVTKTLPTVLSGLHGATVIYSIPPVTTLPPGNAMRAALQAAYGIGAGCFIYFSSAGLFGAEPDDDVWIDDDTPIVRTDAPMTNVLSDEDVVATHQFDRLRTVTLRIAPVYGGGRGVRTRLRKGDYRILDDGQHAISRIYIDDLVKIVFAAEDHAPARSCFLVADDEPTTQGEYAAWLTARMGIEMPPSRKMFESGGPRAHRNRRIRNAHLKEVLGLALTYPTFREGEAAIEAEEAAAAAAE